MRDSQGLLLYCQEEECTNAHAGFGKCGTHGGWEVHGEEPSELPVKVGGEGIWGFLERTVYPMPTTPDEWNALGKQFRTYPTLWEPVADYCFDQAGSVHPVPGLNEQLAHARLMSDYEIDRDFNDCLLPLASEDDQEVLKAYADARKNAPGWSPKRNIGNNHKWIDPEIKRAA
ncbi:MAG: hypothetical protein WDZ96_00215 [Acidimicrobiia bacterium]